jgi:hypothetical protein
MKKNVFKFIQGFWIQNSKIKNTFKFDLNWIQTRINLNKPFEYFSNLELSKISLNIQIQNKALNRWHLK